MKCILISFADSRYQASLQMCKRNTKEFGFDSRYFFSEKDLPSSLIKDMKPYKYRRGFGYWYWKAFLVNEMFKDLSEGDVLVYSDSGNFWNPKGVKRFNEYVEMLAKSKISILAFQQPFLEKDYSKGDLLEYFGVYNDPTVTLSYQLWGGAFILKKTKESIHLISQWLNIFRFHHDLATDKQSVKPNLWGFIENRHDQSIFSILVKKIPHIEIPYYEVSCLDNKFKDMEEYPIWGKRVRFEVRSNREKIKYVLSFPVRFFQGWKLKHFENFVFKDNKLWW